MNLIWLLLGPGDPRESRWLLMLLGGLLVMSGLLVLLDAPGMVTELSLEAFGYILVALGLFRLAFAVVGAGLDMPVRYGAQGMAFIMLGLGVADFPSASDHAVPWFFGMAFLLNGLYQMASALIIRYPHWGWLLLSGLGHLGASLGLFLYWQQVMALLIPVLMGGGLGILGISALRLGWRLSRFTRVAAAQTPEERIRHYLAFHLPKRFRRTDYPDPQAPPAVGSPHQDLLVHIWTPTTVACTGETNPGFLNRYLIAHDAEGKVTVGHAALQMDPDVYISHCDGDPAGYDDADEAWRELRSRDRPGEFLPGFQEELEHYVQPSVTLRFRHFREDQLRTFWNMYRQITTYNLTNRNCSVAVALALEAALMGSLPFRSRIRALGRLMFTRDLWVAHFLRWKAREMVWTPGMMLDYALALHRLVEE